MAVVIDPRLIDADGEAENTENFNRILALFDALEERVQALEDEAESTEENGTEGGE